MKRASEFCIFIKRSSLHAALIWVAVNAASLLIYQYNVFFNLAFTINANGSLISAKDQFINHNLHQPLVFWMLLVAILAEADYWFIFRKKGLPWFLAGSVCLGFSGSAVSFLFANTVTFYPRTAQFLESGVAITAYIAGYAIAYNFFYDRYNNARAGQKRTESELQVLKAQINPHFFFNTLNNLYGMALNENAQNTAAGIELLADMMRYSMNGVSKDFTLLETELKVIESYIALQRLRVPEKENLNININIARPGKQLQIAPMLLIPLIENAWKYGISMDQSCRINLTINVTDDKLVMIVANSVFLNHPNKQGAGLGLNNVRQRLELIYPDRHHYHIEQDENNYKATLSIDL